MQDRKSHPRVGILTRDKVCRVPGYNSYYEGEISLSCMDWLMMDSFFSHLFAGWVILYAFCRVWSLIKVQCFLKKKLSGIPPEYQIIWIQIRTDKTSGLIWIQTVCKGYQQTTKDATSGERVKWIVPKSHMVM